MVQRDTDITWFTQMMGYVHKEICQSFYYSPKIWRDTPCSKTAALPLHTLTVSLPIQYNTISIWFTMLCFIGEIPWENTTVKSIQWVLKTISQHTSQTPRKGEWEYSIPGVQTQLNNISGSGRLGSTTNTSDSWHCYPYLVFQWSYILWRWFSDIRWIFGI